MVNYGCLSLTWCDSSLEGNYGCLNLTWCAPSNEPRCHDQLKVLISYLSFCLTLWVITYHIVYGIQCHVRNSVTYPISRHMLGYTNDKQFHHKCHLLTLDMSMFNNIMRCMLVLHYDLHVPPIIMNIENVACSPLSYKHLSFWTILRCTLPTPSSNIQV